MTIHPRLLAALVLALPLLTPRAHADSSGAGLPQAQSQAETLNANILASSSATLALEQWCAAHAMATPARIVARLQRGNEQAASAEQRTRLGVDAHTVVKHRRVHLYCGDHLMSEADNWYVPSRLSAEMNRLLEETDTPFGKVVQPLAPYRRTFAARNLWAADAQEVPAALFEHRAVLYTAAHQPIAEVRESYQRGVLAFR
ncbi:hypothetical protein GTP41_13620 [Pseudoduganella sp. DS3]|uniref:Uncharacterized protein n=1 Tax=Pseudoduganella guangdongensis TaxID=2692179 RepID=A0A6N9HK76_9BURK|nr:hypothetical protein [Pseudoduganella guangdongensis]MYN03135.1 hypothetical protein [Pseudoduganella guangdongensis]